MGVLVRTAVVGDASAIAGVHAASRRAAYREFIGDELLDRTFAADLTGIWRERLGSAQPPIVFVATDGAQILGYCMLLTPSEDHDSGGGVAELTRMSVTPTAWRSGVGTALMHEALSLLRRDNWATVSLWVLERNIHAQAFYKVQGFHPDGAETIDQWSGQTQLRMRRALTRDSNPAQSGWRLLASQARNWSMNG